MDVLPSSTPRTWRGRVFIATSLDGFIARPDGDIEWLTDPPTGIEHAPATAGGTAPPDYPEFMAGIDHLVVGRATYEKVLGFGGWAYEGQNVIVLSRTLPHDHDERITVARDVDEAVGLLDERGAAGVYVDGGQVVQSFLRADLIDELTIARAPVLIGSGLPLFGTLDHDIRLSLRGTATSTSGMTHATYTVLR